MSTADHTISSDLAALAADNKIRIPALDVTLRALVPAAVEAARDGVAGVALVAAAHAYTRRVGRAAAGAAALACAFALLAWLSNPLGLSTDMAMIGNVVEQYIVYLGPLEVVQWSVFLILVTYIVALRIAERRVARWLAASPPGTLTQHASRIRGLALALRVAGPAALVIALAMTFFANGLYSYCEFWSHDVVLRPMRTHMLAAVLAALLASVGVGVLTRHPRVAERLAHPIVTALGIAVAFTTLVVGARFDVGPRGTKWYVTVGSPYMPSLSLRTALTITGTLAVLLVVASAALRRDRREQRSLS